MRVASIFVTAQFTKQGASKPDATKTPDGTLKDGIPCYGVDYRVLSPIDANTGHTSGKRMHKPLVFVKHPGPSSPQFIQALVTNEPVTSFKLHWCKPASGEKKLQPMLEIILTNAQVVDYSLDIHESDATEAAGSGGDALSAGGGGSGVSEVQLERISLSFQKIEVNWLPAKTAMADDWSS
jgi:type VI secretion system Hcp family effector